MAQQPHPIFIDIDDDDLEAVQERVRADAAVLEERNIVCSRMTPLAYAILFNKPAIALWLLQHRGRHDLETADDIGWTALHHASVQGPPAVVQALVAAGANPAALAGGRGFTPLIRVSGIGNTDLVAFLLQQPAVKASIDHISQYSGTALSRASLKGHQILLDAGADPTIPAGQHSPLNQALSNNHHAVVALLHHIIAEADRVRMCVAWVGTRKGLCKELYLELLGHLLHAWAVRRPEA